MGDLRAVGEPVLWVGDFNAHNPLWGSRQKDTNGEVVEDFLDQYELVCLNDGRSIRFDIRTGTLSCVDLSLASSQLARKARWDTWEESMGSDHFPILWRIGQSSLMEEYTCPRFLNFSKANWKEVAEACSRDLEEVNEGTVDEWSRSLCDMISRNVRQYIPERKGLKQKMCVPWWNRACSEAVVIGPGRS